MFKCTIRLFNKINNYYVSLALGPSMNYIINYVNKAFSCCLFPDKERFPEELESSNLSLFSNTNPTTICVSPNDTICPFFKMNYLSTFKNVPVPSPISFKQ